MKRVLYRLSLVLVLNSVALVPMVLQANSPGEGACACPTGTCPSEKCDCSCSGQACVCSCGACP